MRDPKEIGKIVRELRGNLSLRGFGQKCGVSHTTIDNIEKGVDYRTGKPVQIKMVTIEKIANACGVSMSYITGEPTMLEIAKSRRIYLGDIDDAEFDNMPDMVEPVPFFSNGLILHQPQVYTIPVYESVSAGFGAYANDYIIDYRFVDLSSNEEAQNTLFVKVKGDSMSPKIEDGDLIQVYKTDSVDSGTIAVVMMDNVDGEEAFVKKVVYGHGWVELQSINTKYAPIRFEKEEIDRIRILGEVTSIVRGI